KFGSNLEHIFEVVNINSMTFAIQLETKRRVMSGDSNPELLHVYFRNKGVTSQNITSSGSMNDKDTGTGVGTSHTLTSDQYHRLISLLSDADSLINIGTLAYIVLLLAGLLILGAKQTRDLFLLSEHKTSSLGKLVHLDVWRPYKVTSNDEFNEPYDNERDKNDGGGTNSSSTDHVVESASAYPTSTADPYASTNNKGADSSNVFNPELDSTDKLGSINAEGDADDDGSKDYVVDGKVKYGINTIVNYSNLSCDTFSFTTSLNKTSEPKSFKEDVLDSKWVDAMNSEIEALNKNNTWVVTDLPKGRKPICCDCCMSDSDNAKCSTTQKIGLTGYEVYLGDSLLSYKLKVADCLR
ncbi:hypothetical protein Tco_1011925, partial [Tanacetum coccineum]